MSRREDHEDGDPKRLLDGGAEHAGERAAVELLERMPELPPLGAKNLAAARAEERIWRRVEAGLSPAKEGSNRARARFFVVAGLAVPALLLLLLRGQDAAPPTARVQLAAGAVLAALPSGSFAPAGVGTVLAESSRLRTDEKARAVLTLSRAAVLVAPGSELSLASLRGTTLLQLSVGEVVAEVAPRKSGESFVVQTRRYRVTVKGTLFSVRAGRDDEVVVSVTRGLVEVAGAGGVWLVAAGHSWNSRSAGTLGADVIKAGDRGLVEQAMTGAPRMEDVATGAVAAAPVRVVSQEKTRSDESTAVARRAEGVAGAARSPSGAAGSNGPVAASASPRGAEPRAPIVEPAPPAAVNAVPASGDSTNAPTRKLEELDEPTPAIAENPSPALGSATTPPSVSPSLLPVTTPPAMTPPPASAPPPDAPPVAARAVEPDPYVSALALSRDGRYREAAAALEAITRANGAHADLALYELARLRERRLGDPEGALEALRLYEAQYPHGSLSQEVALSAIELSLGRSDLDGAMARMDRFLVEHKDSERAPKVHLLRGNVLRGRGDCQGALREYGDARGPGVEDDSLYFTAWCQQKLGREDAAASSLRDYMKRFPSGLHVAEVRTALPKH